MTTTLAELVSMRLRRAGLCATSPELCAIRDHNNDRLAAAQFAIDRHEQRGRAIRKAALLADMAALR
jgi:hypothetical protein